MLMGELTQTREEHGRSPQKQRVLKNNKSIIELIKSVMSFSYFPFLHSSFIIFITKLLCIIQAKQALSNHTRDKSHIFHQLNGCFYLREKGTENVIVPSKEPVVLPSSYCPGQHLSVKMVISLVLNNQEAATCWRYHNQSSESSCWNLPSSW